jgi:VanZ family protein
VLSLLYPRRWQTAGIFLLASVLVLALLPAIWFWPGGSAGLVKLPDKFLHGLTFLVLAVWFSGQYARQAYWKLALGLLLFGAMIEACQYLLPYRSAEKGDMFADVAGITIGLTIALLGAGGWSLRVEAWLQEKIG